MNCNFSERVSMLVDNELSAAESKQVREHLADCAECQDLEKDFLFFRRQIKESVSDFVETGQVKIPIFPPRKQTRLWNKWFSLPAPVLALFVFALIGLGAWIISSRWSQIPNERAANTSVKNDPPKTENQSNQISLARFDNGGRAEIYVVPSGAK